MPDISHRIGIKAGPARIRDAVTTPAGIAGWWTRDTTPTADGMEVAFTNGGQEIGRMAFDVTAEAGASPRWRFTAGPEEWVGTDVTFDLEQDGDTTVLLFGHRNWREQGEFMAHCSMKWATFLLSLRDYVEEGTGQPSPDDLKIDNWN